MLDSLVKKCVGGQQRDGGKAAEMKNFTYLEYKNMSITSEIH
jgi:hypothetical protein